MVKIDPTAIIGSNVEFGENVIVGPFTIINDGVRIGNGCTIGSHVVIACGTKIGDGCKVFDHAAIGGDPQDIRFDRDCTTIVEIGDRTTIREFVTISRGTKAHHKTVIGSDCFVMAYAHIAHDCVIGNNVILTNAVNIAGHVEIEDWVNVGGMVPIHQFVKIGQHSFIGGGYRVPKDVPPYVLAAGEPLSYHGLNRVGLKRRGFTDETLRKIREAYNIIYRSKYNVSDALKILSDTDDIIPEVQNIINFIKNSKRGIIR